jgi:hypothetical protein
MRGAFPAGEVASEAFMELLMWYFNRIGRYATQRQFMRQELGFRGGVGSSWGFGV